MSDKLDLTLDVYPFGAVEKQPFEFDNFVLPDKNIDRPLTEVKRAIEQKKTISLSHDREHFIRNGTGLKPLYFSVTLTHYLSIIPILQWEFPAIQYLGARNITCNGDFQAIGIDGAFPEFKRLQEFYSLIDRRALENKRTRNKPLEIDNDIARLFGIDHVVISNIQEQTTEVRDVLNFSISMDASHSIDFEFIENYIFKFANRNTNKFSFYKELMQLFAEQYEFSYIKTPEYITTFFDYDSNTEDAPVFQIRQELPPNLIDPLIEFKDIFLTNARELTLFDDPTQTLKTLVPGFEELRQLYIEQIQNTEIDNSNPNLRIYTVSKVRDGDTIETVGGPAIRILGIDTFEIDHIMDGVNDNKGEEGGQDATDFLNSVLFKDGQGIQVYVLPLSTDVFGRTLAKVFLPDGTPVTQLMDSAEFGKKKRDFGFNPGFIDLHEWYRRNYKELYRALTDENKAKLNTVVGKIGRLDGWAYPDIYLGDGNSSIIEGIATQDLNPDFYIYNRYDWEDNRSSDYQKIFKGVAPILTNRYERYTEVVETAKDMQLESNKDVDPDFGGPLPKIIDNSQSYLSPLTGEMVSPELGISQNQTLQGLTENFEDALKNYKPKYDHFRQAYPTYAIYFMDEDDIETYWRSYSDFYSTDTIHQIMVVRSREIPADAAYIRINNLTGSMLREKYVTWSKYKSPFSEDMDTMNENPIQGIIFKEGTRVQIRMGYDNNPNNLTTVFNGIVTSISGSDVIEVYCQSFALELVNATVGFDRDQPDSGGATLMDELSRSPFGDSTVNKTRAMCQKLLAHPSLQHFGKWYIDKQGIRISDFTNYLWTKIFPTLNRGRIGVDGELRGRWTLLDRSNDDNIFIPDVNGKDLEELFRAASFSYWLTGPASPKPLWVGPFTVYDNSTIWDVFQELILRYPNYICSVVPYDDRMTLFFGHPDHLYAYRDLTIQEELGSLEQLDKLQNNTSPINNPSADEFRILEPLHPYNFLTTEWFKAWNFGALKNTLGMIDSDSDYYKTRLKYVNALRDRDKIAELKFRVKPFREYHLVTSLTNMVSNDIRADFNDTFTICNVQHASLADSDMDEVTTVKLDEDLPDPDDFDFNLYSGSYREFVLPAKNCIQVSEAKRYGVSALCHSLKNLYKGEFIMLGDPTIKPHDVCTIFDVYNDMAGPVGVKQTVLSFSPESGFVNTVSPDCMVEVDSYYSLPTMDAWNKSFHMALSNLKEGFGIRDFNLPIGTASETAIGTTAGKTIGAAFPLIAGAKLTAGALGGWAFGATAILGSVLVIREMHLSNNREPIWITPLVRGGVPFINGVDGLRRGNYYVERIKEIKQFKNAFMDGLDLITEDIEREFNDYKDIFKQGL
jgi:endonuclease YncB( thermonuclease family)